MRSGQNSTEIRRQNKIRTALFVLEQGSVSRQEIALSLGFSLPTVFQNVNELLNAGLLCEEGEFESTGGRKAKKLSINPGYGDAAGLEVTRHHIRLVLTDMTGHMLDQNEINCAYSNTDRYYQELGKAVQAFLESNHADQSRFAGVGVSLPGILNKQLGLLQKSYTLDVSDVSLRNFSSCIPYSTCFDNDATNAACAEIRDKSSDTVFLSLNETVGGAICIGGRLYDGDNFKARNSDI
jgi:hypothetical protein